MIRGFLIVQIEAVPIYPIARVLGGNNIVYFRTLRTNQKEPPAIGPAYSSVESSGGG